MARRSDVRLTRESIVEAALAVSSRDGDCVAPTGQAIGARLGVDRSAIWRHFRDKDDLLLTAADAMMTDARAGLDPTAPARERLRRLWLATVTAFLQHPPIGAELGARFISGPNVVALVEAVFVALQELGVPDDKVGAEYRSFADVMLAYAAMLAQYALLTDEQTASDRIKTIQAVEASASDRRSTLIDAEADLVNVSEREREVVVDTYLAGLAARYAPA